MGGAGADQLGHISIHALREEGDLSSWPSVQPMWQFLSTPSARRATAGALNLVAHDLISIHAPPRGGRPWRLNPKTAGERFLSTPSARRATARRRAGGRGFAISIHALREEGDIPCLLSVKIFTRFLSTPSARRATLCEL